MKAQTLPKLRAEHNESNTRTSESPPPTCLELQQTGRRAPSQPSQRLGRRLGAAATLESSGWAADTVAARHDLASPTGGAAAHNNLGERSTLHLRRPALHPKRRRGQTGQGKRRQREGLDRRGRHATQRHGTPRPRHRPTATTSLLRLPQSLRPAATTARGGP
jgi:hypothetical protein